METNNKSGSTEVTVNLGISKHPANGARFCSRIGRMRWWAVLLCIFSVFGIIYSTSIVVWRFLPLKYTSIEEGCDTRLAQFGLCEFCQSDTFAKVKYDPPELGNIMWFVITGDIMKSSRIPQVMHTWMRHVPRDNVVFCSDKDDDEVGALDVLKLNVTARYVESQMKWVECFLNVSESSAEGDGWSNRFRRAFDKADWVITLDDDTFVIVDRMVELLARFSHDRMLAIGSTSSHGYNALLNNGNWRPFADAGGFHGGAGTVYSKGLLGEVLPHLRQASDLRFKRYGIEQSDAHLAYVMKDICEEMIFVDYCGMYWSTFDAYKKDQRNTQRLVTLHTAGSLDTFDYYYGLFYRNLGRIPYVD